MNRAYDIRDGSNVYDAIIKVDMNGEKTSKPSGKGISNPAVQKQSEAEDVRLLRNKQHLSWSLSKVDQAV